MTQSGKHFRRRDDKFGVAPVIGAILMLAIMISIVGSILMWGIPLLRDMENEAKLDSARSNLIVLDSRTEELMQEGVGSSKSTTVSLAGGEVYFVENLETWLVFYALIPQNITFDNITDGNAGFDISFENHTDHNLSVEITWRHNGTTETYLSDNGHVIANYSLEDGISVFVYDSTPGIPGIIPLAEAFMEDLGGIRYTLQMESGRVEMRSINGALVSDSSTKRGQVVSSPIMSESLSGDSKTVSMFLIDTVVRGIGSGGQGTYNVAMDYLSGETMVAKQVYNMNIKIDSPYSFGYYLHLVDRHGFINNFNEEGKRESVVFSPDLQPECFLVLNYAQVEMETTTT